MVVGPPTWARYDSARQRSLRFGAHVLFTAAIVSCVRHLGLRRHRGCRAGRSVQAQRPTLRPAGNGACVVTGYRPPVHHTRVYGHNPANLISISTSYRVTR